MLEFIFSFIISVQNVTFFFESHALSGGSALKLPHRQEQKKKFFFSNLKNSEN